ncbi:helix-turn-helix domain-containing protein [Yoonia sp. I 8.24]|uniref:helix-turn-helix domain-containing protein n=1 Tax=Yoonia sp. I 8.24 TaxID=1537229 RepID=UPI001EDE1309|nr:helix-turn-helix transcriptional regulator [Yoonia sp. I 8.24]MCG3267355.1 helix-turn-helix transcriptional regulator [Yoonia sp. I 8.24]
MDEFAENLKKRAKQLGISNAEAARRSGLEERRYAHYVSNRREPDLGTLVKIAVALRTTPNVLLGVTDPVVDDPKKAILLERLSSAAAAMSLEEFKIFVIQAEAIADESLKNSGESEAAK